MLRKNNFNNKGETLYFHKKKTKLKILSSPNHKKKKSIREH